MKKKKKNHLCNRKWYRYHFFGTASVQVLKENTVIDTTIADISFSGMGLYSSAPIGKGKKVMIKISFINRSGKSCEDTATGRVDWQLKFGNTYLMGISFDEELTVINQPMLFQVLQRRFHPSSHNPRKALF